MLGEGHSARESIATTGIAFGIAFTLEGVQLAILTGIEASILGILFVWQGSIVAPFVAHLFVQGVFLAAGWRRKEGEQVDVPARSRRGSCPACGKVLSRLEIQFGERFRCPFCGKAVSVCPGYRRGMGLVAIVIIAVYLWCGWGLFAGSLPEQYIVWLNFLLAYGASLSGAVVFQCLFVPNLQLGGANFIMLDLEPPQRRPPGDPKQP